MSGDGRQPADCSDVLRRMYFFIDHELAEADTVRIQEHLDECAPCLHEVDFERVVKALIARSCCETAPPELRQRVMFSIRQVQLELGMEIGSSSFLRPPQL
ncbi:MAG TPA: mycothiol system anti-sigma-R factor [Nocardioidaceae bacterium]|nr:mycothiol system anti-sigma-R factor [Nocardioidaceae bacterium]